MKETEKIDFNNLVLSCAFEKLRTHEEFVPEHVLGVQLSGETHMQTQEETIVYKRGGIMLLRKNQLMRSVKVPARNGEYKSILVLLNEDVLRRYAAEHKIAEQKRYSGKAIMVLKSNSFLRGYASSLLPYVNNPVEKNNSLSIIKIYESIELLLRQDPKLKGFLFDFNKPYKIDIEKFMIQNFKFNVPLTQFARLTGRSAAAFKRDFKSVFGQPPRQWLQQKRLSEAYRLIKEKRQKPADIYLDLGFENLSHFYYSFKRKYGLTPLESYSAKPLRKE